MKQAAFLMLLGMVPLTAIANGAKKPSDLVWSIEQSNNVRAYGLEWVHDSAGAAYEVETLRGDDTYDTRIDPMSGKILEEEKDNGVPMLWEPISTEEKSILRQTRYPLALALKSVENSGIVTQARIAKRSGDIGYAITFKDERLVFVSGITGAVSQ